MKQEEVSGPGLMAREAVGFTPGPWVVDRIAHLPDDYYLEDLITAADGALIGCTISETSRKNFARTKPNARLIAAAPDLLEALQGIIDWADLALRNPREFDSHGVRNLDGPAFDTARAALSKATAPSQQQGA